MSEEQLTFPQLDPGQLNKMLEAGVIKMRGGSEYLQVANRVLAFRHLNTQGMIHTNPLKIGERHYMQAQVIAGGRVMATAIKEIKFEGGKGAAGQYPAETAETGAIGRALALCGFGTLMGDLDEGDQIADAPIENKKQSKGR